MNVNSGLNEFFNFFVVLIFLRCQPCYRLLYISYNLLWGSQLLTKLCCLNMQLVGGIKFDACLRSLVGIKHLSDLRLVFLEVCLGLDCKVAD